MTAPELPTYGDLRERVTYLLELTRTALESDQHASSLATALPHLDDSPLRIALAGPHNAGKSMLIAALLELPQDEVEAMTAATPLTTELTPYYWSDYVLLDLPGTLSGLDEHDSAAAAGVRRADLLLLVTSVELPGEAETHQINHLLGAEGFAQRALVVLNKCNTEENDPDEVMAEMRSRLASYPWIEVLFADAKDYIDSRNRAGLKQEHRELLRKDSGIDEVVAALGSLAAGSGRTARLQALCHEIRRTSAEASILWAPDHDQEAQELVADRIRMALADARTELTDATDLAVETLTSAITGIGTRLAAAVSEEDGSVDTRSATEAEASESKSVARCEEAINRAVEEVLARLDAQLGATLEDADRYSVEVDKVDPGIRGTRIEKKKRGKVDEALEQAWDSGVRRVRQKIGDFVDGGGREGSAAHNAAKKLNAARKVPIKPYTHRRVAEKLTKVGKVAGTASAFLLPLFDVKETLGNLTLSSAVKKRREEIRSAYVTRASTVAADQREAIDAHVEERLGLRYEAVAAILEAAQASAQARAQAQEEWAALFGQAQELAALIDRALLR